MKTLRFTGLLIAAACTAASVTVSASEFDSPEPSMYWRMEFGSHEQATALRYGLTLRQADTEARDVALPALATLDFSPHGAGATLAGLPVWQRQYRVSQSEAAAAGEATEGGWLSDLGDAFAGLGVGTGTLVVAGGVAVGLILLSTDADDDPPQSNNTPPNPSPNDPPDGECLVPSPAPTGGCIFNPLADANEAVHVSASDHRWLDAGTGQMGDLIAR